MFGFSVQGFGVSVCIVWGCGCESWVLQLRGSGASVLFSNGRGIKLMFFWSCIPGLKSLPDEVLAYLGLTRLKEREKPYINPDATPLRIQFSTAFSILTPRFTIIRYGPYVTLYK